MALCRNLPYGSHKNVYKLKYAEVMALCLINGVTQRNLPYGNHKNVYRATVIYGKLDKKF